MSSRHRLSPLRLVLVAVALLSSSIAAPPALAQIAEVGDGTAGPFKAVHLSAELTSLGQQIPMGGQLQAGLVLTVEEHWHVYWINAGDSGEPPSVKWTLPEGITAGPLQFPPPSRLPLGQLMNYGYEDHVAYPITLSAASSAKPGKTHLDAHVSWLVCSVQSCIPGKAHLGLDVDVVTHPVSAAPPVGALGEAVNTLPQPLPDSMKAAAVSGQVSSASGPSQAIDVTVHTGKRQLDAEFYPFDPNQIANAADQVIAPLSDGVTVRLLIDPIATAAPTSLHGLLKLGDAEAYDLTVPVTPGTLAASLQGANRKHSSLDKASSITLFSAVILALLGGLLLNLMPCVFPVLFLKGLALVNSSGEERSRQRLHGLMYTLGILVSFWAVVTVLLVLRAGGRELGWGFQLQSPTFVAMLAMLLFFLALSLAGQFELGLSLTSAGGGLAQKQGLTGSFFTGVLATVVATPCMAPLMGAAVAFALAQPAWITFLVFTTLGVGLALPYLALTLQPQWTRILPRPGAWMEVLKQLTAVPLFATAIWLAWVFGHLYSGSAGAGVDRLVWLLASFLVIAVAGWALGKWPARWGSAIVAIALLAFAVFLPLRKPKAETLAWQSWTPQTFAAARASGKPVFIDFTADWCLSCKFNEGAVLRSHDVESMLAQYHVELLKADWTRYDPEITRQLSSLNRSGVPTYVVYPAGGTSNPDVLPELLTKDLVLRALDRDAKPDTQLTTPH